MSPAGQKHEKMPCCSGNDRLQAPHSRTPGGGQSQAPGAGWFGELPRGRAPHVTPPAPGGRGTRPGPGPQALAFAEASPVRALHSHPSSAPPPTLAWTGAEQTLESHATEDRAPTPERRTTKATQGCVLGEGRCGAWSGDRAIPEGHQTSGDSGILGMRDPQTRSHLQVPHRSPGTQRWCLS